MVRHKLAAKTAFILSILLTRLNLGKTGGIKIVAMIRRDKAPNLEPYGV